jgi:hypothetical protein
LSCPQPYPGCNYVQNERDHVRALADQLSRRCAGFAVLTFAVLTGLAPRRGWKPPPPMSLIRGSPTACACPAPFGGLSVEIGAAALPTGRPFTVLAKQNRRRAFHEGGPVLRPNVACHYGNVVDRPHTTPINRGPKRDSAVAASDCLNPCVYMPPTAALLDASRNFFERHPRVLTLGPACGSCKLQRRAHPEEGVAMSLVGPPLPTCAVHQCRQLFEVLRTCRTSDQHSRC